LDLSAPQSFKNTNNSISENKVLMIFRINSLKDALQKQTNLKNQNQ
jgi:hypothetical protein